MIIGELTFVALFSAPSRRALAVPRDWVTFGAILTETHFAAVQPELALWTFLFAMRAEPASQTNASAADTITGGAVLAKTFRSAPFAEIAEWTN